MEVIVDCQFLDGAQNEHIVKELSIAAKDVLNTFHFKSPYKMRPHGSATNGLNWDDGIIPYEQLYTVLRPWRDTLTSTVTELKNANIYRNYQDVHFLIWRTWTAHNLTISNFLSTVACLAINLHTSVAQPEMRILSITG
jgi:hypothetical protein